MLKYLGPQIYPNDTWKNKLDIYLKLKTFCDETHQSDQCV